jgi:omega-hydroxy-beta-dihydromenaquinone-9 sulfotransferase
MAANDSPPTIQYSNVSPRFWHGMPSRIWFRELARNRFQLSLSRLHLTLGVTSFMPMSDLLSLMQHVVHRKAILRTELAGPPIFVLGHWRSGTTLLHELLTLDDRYASPTTYQCFAPSHFLMSEGLVTKYGSWLIPNKRPMDNMKAGWTLPQEDEFALMNLGAPTPYLRLMFPRNEFPYKNTLSSSGFTEEQLREWKRLFDWFLRALTYKTGKPLILKSPPHTGRLGILKQMYPDAKFIHIARDPRKLFPSTMKLWKSLDRVQALQAGEDEPRLRQFVFDSLRTMYDAFERDRIGIPPNQITDVRYEELAHDQMGVIRKVYETLELPDFDRIEPLMMARVQQEKEYKTNRFGEDPQEEALIMHEWRAYADRYGYS